MPTNAAYFSNTREMLCNHSHPILNDCYGPGSTQKFQGSEKMKNYTDLMETKKL